MKVLRTVSIVVVFIGIFAWLLIPFFSAGIFQSSDGIPALSLISYSNSDYSWCKTTPLYWLPIVSIVLLGVCLLFTFLNDFRWIGVFSFIGVVTLASGGRLTQTILGKLPSYLSGGNLSVGFYLLIGVFAILVGLSIVSFCNVKDVLRAVSILFVIVGGGIWFVAPLLSYDTFHNVKAISFSSCAFVYGLEPLSIAKETWQTTSLYWMSLATIILLGVCLLFILLKDFRWVCACSFVGITALIVGGILSAQLKLIRMHLGIGFYLLIGLFAVLLGLSILHLVEAHTNAKNSDATKPVAELSE